MIIRSMPKYAQVCPLSKQFVDGSWSSDRLEQGKRLSAMECISFSVLLAGNHRSSTSILQMIDSHIPAHSMFLA
jgi:hypothetical protein